MSSLSGGSTSFPYRHFVLQWLSYLPSEYGTEVEPGNGSPVVFHLSFPPTLALRESAALWCCR